MVTPCSTCASQSSSSSLESATHGASTEPPVPSSTCRWARSVSALTVTPPPPPALRASSAQWLVVVAPPVFPRSTPYLSTPAAAWYLVAVAGLYLPSFVLYLLCAQPLESLPYRLHPNRYSSDTELPFCLIHLRIPAFTSSDLLSRSSLPAFPSRSCLTFATSTRSSLIAAASFPVTLRAQ